MEFRILGSLEVEVAGEALGRVGSRQERLLAALLLEANRVVSAARLVQAIWDDTPPPTAARQVHNAVSALRKGLVGAGLSRPDEVLVTEGAGYLLRVEVTELDWLVFEERVRAAQRLVGDGDPASAAAELGGALALWRGPALSGVGGRVIAAGARQLDESRLAAWEQRLELELALGRHRELVGELSTLVAEHPLSERLVAHLMLALYRCGRRAEALAVYRRFHRRLADELGLDPGPQLRRRHEAILRNDLSLDVVTAPAAVTVPVRPGPPALPAVPVLPVLPVAQLPADVRNFCGRAAHLAELTRCLGERPAPDEPDPDDTHPGDADDIRRGHADGAVEASGRSVGGAGEDSEVGGVRIAVIAGTAGVGKTALAVHWAHRVADRFPDGQLYVDLGGYASPTPPAEVLNGLLRCLGVPPEHLPAGLQERAALYRSLLAGRHMLVVLDNAAGADQVRPLLPGTADCLALVTSRDDLLGLVATHGAALLQLGVLSEDEAVDLLERLVGERRAAAEPDAVAELAALCAYLPLALRIAGANLLGHPHRRVAEVVTRLVAGDRLAELEVPGDRHAAVRAAFDLSYRALRPSARALFRRLGLVPGREIGPALAARLLDRPTDARPGDGGTGDCWAGGGRADGELDELATAHLVEQHVAGRYRCHDLLRIFAAERAAEDEEPQARADCRQRMFDHYLRLARAAAAMLSPAQVWLTAEPRDQPFADVAEAQAWLDTERAELLAAILDAAEEGRAQAWQLAEALRGYFVAGGHHGDWQASARAGLAAAQRAGDLTAQAVMHNNLGVAHWSSFEYDEAVEQLGHGRAVARRTGDLAAEAAALGNLGNVFWQVGRLPEALEHCHLALPLLERVGNRYGVATILSTLATTYADAGRPDHALDHGTRALAVYREIGSRTGVAASLNNLAGFHREAGHLDRAGELAAQALVIAQETGFHTIEVDTHENLAAIHRDAGRYGPALEYGLRALELAREHHNSRFEAAALATLGGVYQALARTEDAARAHRRARQLGERTGHRRVEVEALLGLVEVALSRDRRGEAAGHARAAVALAERFGLGVLQRRARSVLAAVPR